MPLPSFYDFCCRVKTISGINTLEQIPSQLANMKAGRPMIISDKGVAATGLIQVVIQALGDQLQIGEVYDQVPVDSDYRVVDDAAKIYRTKGCDAIIAVGGGSVIDTAKGVNIVASLGGDTLLDYEGLGTVKRKLKPLVVVPTTAGTGSEMTLVAVIADPDRKIKMLFPSYFILPDLAVIDPRMTKTLPAALTASTAMDAMTHACEAYYCLEKNPLSDSFAFRAIQLISQHLLKVLQNPADLQGRLALANASAMAGIAFSNSMVGMVHNLGHTVGALCHVPHGVAMSIFLPYGLEYNLHRCADIIGELLFALAGPEIFAATPKSERPEKVVTFIRQMNQDLHTATTGKHPRCLKEVVDRNGAQLVSQSMLPAIAEAIMLDGARLTNPEEFLPTDALTVLSNAWEGSPLDLKKVNKGGSKVNY
ncbi:MAG: iron-containing alcohol dehydrogenase [Desulfobacteraceae bacterium]|nr:iron-containing alcohol dehydrogenase [Desulfobacteraceae bacterium]